MTEPIDRTTSEPMTQLDGLRADIATLLRGFDQGVFVRNIDGDHDPAWAIKLFPFLGAMARLQKFVEEESA